MNELIVLMFSAIFVNNIVLSRFLGICPFIGVSKRTDAAMGMSFAVIFVMVLSTLITWPLYHYVLVKFKLEYMMIVAFILIIAFLVQMVEVFIKRFSKKLYQGLGIYLPLITTNCAILGVAFLNVMQEYTFVEAFLFSLASGIGFFVALLLMSAIREKLELGEVPSSFRNVPIAFIIAGMMSLAFMGFKAIIG
jgi:Na+-translocating ferredoxin:NAD+ oxidoreductase subunit A